jgi:AraC-like DNA-binding protein
VESHIHDAVTVQQMSDAACYSLFHFCRVFNTTTWFSPYDYAMRWRLSVAARELTTGSRSITDIALDYGFQSPDGFTRAFRRMFGVAPSQARGEREVDWRRVLSSLDESRIEALLAYRHDGEHTRPQDTAVAARVVSGPTSSAALTRILAKRGPDESWVGIHDPGHDSEEVQVFAGIAEAADTATTYRFTTTIPRGSYHALSFTGSVERLGLMGELLYSTIWPRMERSEPPDRWYIQCHESSARVLVPMAARDPAPEP